MRIHQTSGGRGHRKVEVKNPGREEGKEEKKGRKGLPETEDEDKEEDG